MQKEIVIPDEFKQPEWQTNKVEIKRWTLGMRNEILDQVSKFKPTIGKIPQAPEIQGGFTQILTILKCVVKAPWAVGDIGAVNELQPELGDWLFNQISEFNGGIKNPPSSEELSKV